MADSVKPKQNTQTYLRQVQQEKARYKRELMRAEKEDMKAVREHYKDQMKQLDQETSAAIVDIKAEARQMAEAEKQEREQRAAEIAEQKRLDREERQAQMSEQAESSSVEKKNLLIRKGDRAPVVQNYETKDSDDFYRVQDRGSRVTEGPDHYVIEAYAPEHEKDNLRVSVQRDKAVISGQRRFSDEAKDNFKSMRTNNYQSFREEFSFNRPVSGEGMTRERVGDYVRFVIPKLEAVGTIDENT